MKWLFVVSIALHISFATCGRLDSQESRMGQEKHFQGGKHNKEYDREAFLGKELKKTFDQLTEKEAKEFLGKIVDKIDKDKNGSVTRGELKEWIKFRGSKWLNDDASRLWKYMKEMSTEIGALTQKEREMAMKTLDMNEPITWEVYKHGSFRYADEKDPDGAEKIRIERRRWQTADKDKDGRLNYEEYKSVLHPEAFEHTKIVHVQESLEEADKNKDGYVSPNEYIDRLYSGDESRKDREAVEADLKDFHQIRDKNKDGKLDLNEMWEYLIGPAGVDVEGNEADHLIHHADDNEDGVLTKEEIVKHHDIFVGSAATDYGNDLPIHDEI